MNHSLKANATSRFFANRKDRSIDTKAKTNGRITLHAHAAHAFYRLCDTLRGLLCASTRATAWQAEHATQPLGSWMSAMQPCRVAVRRGSPGSVVKA